MSTLYSSVHRIFLQKSSIVEIIQMFILVNVGWTAFNSAVVLDLKFCHWCHFPQFLSCCWIIKIMNIICVIIMMSPETNGSYSTLKVALGSCVFSRISHICALGVILEGKPLFQVSSSREGWLSLWFTGASHPQKCFCNTFCTDRQQSLWF